MEKFEGRELVAQFPPQGCGPSPPPEVAVAGGAAHVDVSMSMSIQWMTSGEGSREAAQPTMASTPSASDSYVASSN